MGTRHKHCCSALETSGSIIKIFSPHWFVVIGSGVRICGWYGPCIRIDYLLLLIEPLRRQSPIGDHCLICTGTM
jgi:hypothetical protein